MQQAPRRSSREVPWRRWSQPRWLEGGSRRRTQPQPFDKATWTFDFLSGGKNLNSRHNFWHEQSWLDAWVEFLHFGFNLLDNMCHWHMNNETKILCTYWRFIGVLFKRILFGICAAVHAYWQDAGGFYILNPAPTNCLLQTILSPAPTILVWRNLRELSSLRLIPILV